MKISKSYLKQVIKEEINTILLLEQETAEKVIKIRVDDFLKLTTDENMYPISDLEKRYPRTFNKDNLFTRQSFEAQKYKPYLRIDNNGKVTDHEGRLRMYALKKLEGDSAVTDVTIKMPLNYDLEHNSVLTNQFNPNTKVDLDKTSESEELPDFLGKKQTFESDILPPNDVRKQEIVNNPAYKKARVFIFGQMNKFDNWYYKNIKKIQSNDQVTNSMRKESAAEYEKYINKNYKFTAVSEKGETTLKAVKAPNISIFQFIPQPDDRDSITIEKR